MHEPVEGIFPFFSEKFEGHVLWPYLDIKGLVTVGIGNLIDPVSEALKLPWKSPGGQLASKDRVREDWAALKAQQSLSRLHYKYAAAHTTIRLTEEDVAELVRSKLAQNEVVLKRYFPAWDDLPADVQLCCCSMAWAVGAGFPKIFTNFTRLINAGDFKLAIEACDIKSEGNPGVIPRNAANKLCLANGWKASRLGMPKSVLYWPGVPPASTDPEWSLKELADNALAKHQLDMGASSAGANVADYEMDDT
jgi:GH24 family phage-related lysozyme (muramidase)